MDGETDRDRKREAVKEAGACFKQTSLYDVSSEQV